MCSIQIKRRDFSFDLKNYTEDEYNILLNMDCRYIILGKEIDDETNRKLQGYIYFDCPKTFQSVKKLIPRVETNELQKTPKLNYQFCSKQNQFEERGELPNNRGEKKDNSMLGKVIYRPKNTNDSFASHEKAKFWSSINQLKPEEVFLNSHKSYWFDCQECNHSYESILNNINMNNSGCPYCYNRKLCGKEECKSCFEKSFASHEKSKFWSNKNILNPNQVFKGSPKKYYFICDKCNHELFIGLKQISSQGHWCSYCSHQKLCDDNNCEYCFNNSFASIERSKYLHDNNIKPRTLFKSTNKTFDFNCDLCNTEFKCQLSDVTKGVWCPFCVNKTEKILFNKLNEKYISLKSQYKVDWCKNINYLPFDFVIEDKKIIIELDGKQHFEQIKNWVSPEKTRMNDLYKMKCANDNRFSIIRILQKDVYKNKYDWLNELISNIEKITKEDRVQNIYMCKNNEYKDFD